MRLLIEAALPCRLLADRVVDRRQRNEIEIWDDCGADSCPRRQERPPASGNPRHRLHQREPELLPQPLKCTEEKRFFLDNGTADRSAELIPVERRLLHIEEVLRIES